MKGARRLLARYLQDADVELIISSNVLAREMTAAAPKFRWWASLG